MSAVSTPTPTTRASRRTIACGRSSGACRSRSRRAASAPAICSRTSRSRAMSRRSSGSVFGGNGAPSAVRSAARRSGALRRVGLKPRTPRRARAPFIRFTIRGRSPPSPCRSRLGRLASSCSRVGTAAMLQCQGRDSEPSAGVAGWLPSDYPMWFYADLKAYKRAPDRRRRHELRARFDRIFRRRTGFATLDRLLARLHANKEELLLVLERPELPLHTNGSERDLRPQVIKRKISGGTRSEAGRACRDAFLGLLLTCAKLRVSFWDYLGHRLGVPGADAPYLPDLVRMRSAPA